MMNPMVEVEAKNSAMTPAPLEGKCLGKYRILEPIGRGGMAQVYKAYHPQLDRYVAVKVLRSDLVEDAEFLARFRREARAVAALRRELRTYAGSAEVTDLLVALDRHEGPEVEQMRSILNEQLLRRHRSSWSFPIAS